MLKDFLAVFVVLVSIAVITWFLWVEFIKLAVQ